MAIEKVKVGDGFFEWEDEKIINDGSNESEQAIADLFDNITNIESELNKVEKRINILLRTPQKEITSNSQLLKDHIEKYKELDQVNQYANQALDHLEKARKFLKEHNTAQAMIETLWMSEAYWRGVIHTESIKRPILVSKANVQEGKLCGQKSGEVRRDKTKTVADRWQEEANKIWKKHPTWSCNRVAGNIAAKTSESKETIRKKIKKSSL
ncbi:MAG: hypothetical protein ABFD50_07350 [Smithella sp.]